MEPGGGQPVLSFEQCFILFSTFPLLLSFGGLGFEFFAGWSWRHALRSERPFIIPPLSTVYSLQACLDNQGP